MRLALLCAALLAGCSSPPAAPAAEDFGPPCQDGVFSALTMPVVLEDDAEAYVEGGMAALLERVEYPREARRSGIQGTVTVVAVVSPAGTAFCTAAAEPVHSLLDAAARRAVWSTPFVPLEVDGRAVTYGIRVPVSFRLG